MIDVVQFAVASEVSSVMTQSVSLDNSSVQGNLIAIIGKYSVIPGSVITVSDSLGNNYNIDQPSSDLIGNSYWLAYAVLQSTGIVDVEIIYSQPVSSSSYTVIEFFGSIGWVNPPIPDGLSFASASSGATTLTAPPITTTNADDLIIVFYTKAPGSTVTLDPVWNLVVLQDSLTAVAWMEVIPAGSVTFTATQSIAGSYAVSLWAIQANLVAPNTLIITTAVVNPTAFIEAYQNRITEDIYDSLEGQPAFVYVQYGPSLLNG